MAENIWLASKGRRGTRSDFVDTMTINKILAGLLIGLLLTKGVSMLADGRFHVEAPETPAYAVALPDAEGDSTEVAEAEGPSLAALLAEASVDRGKRSFAKCAACHTAEKGGADRIGPNLYGVVGGPVAHSAGFNYSDALANHGGTWTYELLSDWLLSPNNAIPNNKMAFAGLRRDGERADVIVYLRSLADQPEPLPAVENGASGD